MITIIGISLLFGLLYGGAFVLQQGRLFSSGHSRSPLLTTISWFLLKIVILILYGRYLLPSPPIPFILGVSSFVTAFWLAIMLHKMWSSHEHSRSH